MNVAPKEMNGSDATDPPYTPLHFQPGLRYTARCALCLCLLKAGLHICVDVGSRDLLARITW